MRVGRTASGSLAGRGQEHPGAALSTRAVIDGCAGPGGWDRAAAELGIQPLGIECDDAACATRDAAGLRTLHGDVAALDPPAVLTEFFGALAVLWGLIFSPPCPTFSAAGQGAGRLLTDIIVECLRELAAGNDTRAFCRADAFELLDPVVWAAEQAQAKKKGRRPDRERARRRARRDADMSLLVVEPLRWALALKPEWIALEQVPACLPLWEELARILDGFGYSTWTGKLEFERYGVPQTRDRAVLLASRTGVARPPAPTHQRYVAPRRRSDDEPPPPGLFDTAAERIVLPEDRHLLPWVSMADALGWGMTERPSVTVAAKASETGGRRGLAAGSGAIRTIDAERARGAWVVQTGNFSASAAGSMPYERSIDAPAPVVTGNVDRWKVVRPVWAFDRPATTVNGDPRIAAPGRHDPDESGSQYGPGTVRVTVEEAAALQTFPPGYPWQGTRGQQFTAVGNAVPPLAAFHILRAVTGLQAIGEAAA